MSFVDPGIGDIVYSQYAVVDSLPIKAGVGITKGRCFTADADGFLIALTAASGNVNNKNGIFQAMADSAAVTGESDGDRRVQCLMKRSRVLLKAPVNATPGDDVAIAASGTNVTADTIQLSSTQKIGTIFEIYTLAANRSRKAKTAAGDLVVVDLLE